MPGHCSTGRASRGESELFGVPEEFNDAGLDAEFLVVHTRHRGALRSYKRRTRGSTQCQLDDFRLNPYNGRLLGRFVCLLALVVASLGNAQQISRSGNHVFSEQQSNGVITLVGFLSEAPVTRSEAATLRSDLIAEFQASPAGFLEGYKQVEEILKAVQEAKSIPELGGLRMGPISTFYQVSQATPASQQPATLRLLFKRNPVLAFDPKNEMALTKRDLDNALRYIWFMQGVPEPNDLQKKEMDAFGQAIARDYLKIGDEQKLFIAVGSIIWAMLDNFWTNATQDEKEQFVDAYAKHIAANQPTEQASAPVPESLQDMERHYRKMSLIYNTSHIASKEALGKKYEYVPVDRYGRVVN